MGGGTVDAPPPDASQDADAPSVGPVATSQPPAGPPARGTRARDARARDARAQDARARDARARDARARDARAGSGGGGGASGGRAGGIPGWCWDAAIVAVYVVLAVACFWNAWSSGLGSSLQQNGDVFDSVWFLTWLPHSVLHADNPFFSNYANFPTGINLMTNTSVFLLGLLGSPVTLLDGPVATYYVMATLSFAGSATVAYFVFRRWIPTRWAAGVGGLLYGFSPYAIGQGLGHLNLIFTLIPPLLFLLLYQITVEQRSRPLLRGALLGLLCVAQFFVSPEVLATSIVMGGILLVCLAIGGWHQILDHLAYLWRALLAAVVVAGALLAYPIWAYASGPHSIKGPVQEVNLYRADLFGILVPDSMQRLAPGSLASLGDKFGGGISENGSYLGIVLVLVLLVGFVVLWRRPIVRVVAAFGVAAWVLSLGARLVVRSVPPVNPNGSAQGLIPLPGAVLAKLPFFKVGLPVRYSLYVAFAAGMLLAVILDGIQRAGAPSITRSLASVGVAAACLIPLVPDVPYPMAATGTPPFFTTDAVQSLARGSPVVMYPYPSDVFPFPTLWQAESYLRFRLVGGYYLVPTGKDRAVLVPPANVGTTPTITAVVFSQLYGGSPMSLTPSLRRRVQTQLTDWGIKTVLAFPYGTTPTSTVIPYLTRLLGTAPVQRQGAYVWDRWRM